MTAQASAGSIADRPAGIVRDPNTVTDIRLLSGQRAEDVDFCEHAPAQLEWPCVPRCRQQRSSLGHGTGHCPGADQLMDASDQVVATAETDANGFYQFRAREPASRHLLAAQIQPEGWWDGQDLAGQVDGEPSGQAQNPGDEIHQIQLGWGQTGVNYDFGELLPSSIQGLVHIDLNNDGQQQEGESPLADVRVDLLDVDGQLVQSAVTDHEGRFRFPKICCPAFTHSGRSSPKVISRADSEQERVVAMPISTI